MTDPFGFLGARGLGPGAAFDADVPDGPTVERARALADRSELAPLLAALGECRHRTPLVETLLDATAAVLTEACTTDPAWAAAQKGVEDAGVIERVRSRVRAMMDGTLGDTWSVEHATATATALADKELDVALAAALHAGGEGAVIDLLDADTYGLLRVATGEPELSAVMTSASWQSVVAGTWREPRARGVQAERLEAVLRDAGQDTPDLELLHGVRVDLCRSRAEGGELLPNARRVLAHGFGTRKRAVIDVDFRLQNGENLHWAAGPEETAWGANDRPRAACGHKTASVRPMLAANWDTDRPERRCRACVAIAAAEMAAITGPERVFVADGELDAVIEDAANRWADFEEGEAPGDLGWRDPALHGALTDALAGHLAADPFSIERLLGAMPGEDDSCLQTVRALSGHTDLAALLSVADWKKLVRLGLDTAESPRLALRELAQDKVLAAAKNAPRTPSREVTLAAVPEGHVQTALASGADRDEVALAAAEHAARARAGGLNAFLVQSGVFPDACRTLVKLETPDGYASVHFFDGAGHPLGLRRRARHDRQYTPGSDLDAVTAACGMTVACETMRVEFSQIAHGMYERECELIGRCHACAERLAVAPETRENPALVGYETSVHDRVVAGCARRLRGALSDDMSDAAFAGVLDEALADAVAAEAVELIRGRHDWLLARALLEDPAAVASRKLDEHALRDALAGYARAFKGLHSSELAPSKARVAYENALTDAAGLRRRGRFGEW